MHRVTRLFAVACSAAALVARPDAAVGFDFNFNSDPQGWTFGTITGSGADTNTPYWFFEKASSKLNGGLQAYLTASGSGAGAWAMSPCLALKNGQPEINIDFTHYTLFSGTNILGQVQFRLDTTGTGWGEWQGIPEQYWDTKNHVPPTERNVFPPLLSSTSAIPNDWMAFSGTNVETSQSGSNGAHVLSGFTIPWSAFGGKVGDEFQMRFVLGVNEDIGSSGTTPIWEVNSVDVKNGLELCSVPEPSALALAGGAAAGLVILSRRRRARRSRADRKSEDCPSESPCGVPCPV